jgi:hypothetical protein
MQLVGLSIIFGEIHCGDPSSSTTALSRMLCGFLSKLEENSPSAFKAKIRERLLSDSWMYLPNVLPEVKLPD